VFSVLFVLFLGGTPWILRAVDRLSDAGTGVTQALSLLGTNPTHARAAETAMTALRERPSDWAAAAALGLSQKRLGQTEDAIKTLRRAAALVPAGSPEAGLVKNNLANTLFATGRALSAEKLYVEAIGLLPKAPEPYFNLSRLYTRTTQLEKARARFAEASALDPDRVAKWNEDTELNLNRWVADMDLSTDLLTRRELATLFAPSPLASRAWLQLAGPVPEYVAPVGCVATLLTFVVLGTFRKRLRIMAPCSRCALAAEVDLGAAETAPLCEQCHNLFIRNIPVDRRIRFEKEERIARVRTLRLWSLRGAALALPGLPSFVTGHPLRGSLLTGAVALLALRLALPEGLLFEPFGGAPPTQTHTLVLAGLLGLLWLGGFVQTWRNTRELG
jgi:Tfp pilus assembly protein PilF